MDTLVKQSQPEAVTDENFTTEDFEILDKLRYEQIDLEHIDLILTGNFTRSTDYPFW